MRTTLDIDNDVLQAAKERARCEKKTTGEMASELQLIAMTVVPTDETEMVLPGFRPFAPRGKIVTNELINGLHEGDAD